MIVKLFRIYKVMVDKTNDVILLNVIKKIVNFYLALGSHYLGRLKFEQNMPINSVEDGQYPESENVNSQELNN